MNPPYELVKLIVGFADAALGPPVVGPYVAVGAVALALLYKPGRAVAARPWLGVLPLGSLALAGCGASSESPPEASKPPREILSDAAAALRKCRAITSRERPSTRAGGHDCVAR